MDLTTSNSYVTDAGTGQRMHLQSQATPTAVSDADLNGLTWEAVAVINAAGLAPAAFDKTLPATYTQVRNAIAILSRQQTNTAFTTTGVAPNFVLTPTLLITAYSPSMRFRVKFSVAGSGANAININGLGNKLLKQYDASGAKIAAVIAAGQLADVEYDEVDFVVLDPLPTSAVTTASDAAFADSSVRPASTGWIRGAMSAIAVAAGFSSSFTANGYVKFPTWLGGLVIQWGNLSASASVDVVVTFPISFPSACHAVFATHGLYSGVDMGSAVIVSKSSAGFSYASYQSGGARNGATNVFYFSIGI